MSSHASGGWMAGQADRSSVLTALVIPDRMPPDASYPPRNKTFGRGGVCRLETGEMVTLAVVVA
jgi:hypothetical protein